jgi:hypothetical protein
MNANKAVDHQLTPEEQDLLASFQRRLVAIQAELQAQYNGVLQGLIVAHKLPKCAGGYSLSPDGSRLLSAPEVKADAPK